jgi:hypothetical protein
MVSAISNAQDKSGNILRFIGFTSFKIKVIKFCAERIDENNANERQFNPFTVNSFSNPKGSIQRKFFKGEMSGINSMPDP